MGQLGLDLGGGPALAELARRLFLTATPAGISRVALRPARGPAASRPAPRAEAAPLRQAREELAEYLAGRRTFFTLPLDLASLSPFDRAALDAAAAIPYGQTQSYAWIAERLGHPGAARAVGAAMAANPVPLLLPCHRVVRSDGGLGGYIFGLPVKAALLELERRRLAEAASPALPSA